MDLENDSAIEEVTPLKTKKLKQARLTFSKLCPSKPLSDNVSSKKRKLESPRESKTAKIIKITAKENSAEDIEIIDEVVSETKTSSSSKSNTEMIDIENEEEETPDKSEHHDKGSSNKSRSKRSLFSKTKKKESLSPSTPLTKFLMKKNSENDKNTSMEDNTKEKTEQSNVSSSQNSNENSDKDSNVVDDDILEIEINDTEISEISDNTELQQINKSSFIDSDSEIDISSDNEDNTKESEKKEITNLNVKDSDTPTQTIEKTDITKNIKTTPKQLRKQESAKKRKEREQLRLEKEKKREEERENRRKEKEEKRKEKEEKEKVEREQKKKEKEQKELKKQMEIEQKQKEKEAKEQERRKKEEAREEERKRKEEEKLESERKKQKAASTFVSFFVPKKQEIKSTEEENNTDVQTFMPFEVKADMRIAPICRRSLEKNKKLSLDNKLNKGSVIETSHLYLAEMKDKKIIRHKSEKTWPLEAKNNDIVVLDEEENDSNTGVVFQSEIAVDKTRPKLLQFHENRRPPYWGTWRKQSDSINPRRPFSKDSRWFDYEVDSDEEWEEEEPGESLHGSEDEKDEENPEDNEYDVDNEFIVPHGYLSDEEARPDEEEDVSMTPETQKFKLKLLGEEFEAERKTKTSQLKPRIIGCVWLGPNNSYPDNTPKKVIEFLTARHAWVSQIPVVLSSSMNENADADSTPSRTQTPASTRKRKVPEEALPDLVRLIHGNMHGKNFLVKEFLTFWNKQTASKDNQISKASLVTKIGEIGRWMPCPDEGQMHLKACWYVSEDFRKRYLGEDEELVLPNRWKYNLTPKRKSEINLDNNDKTEKLEKDTDKDKKKVPLITQFTKKITQEEMKRQLATEPKQDAKPKPILQRPPKRAVLISVPKNDKKKVVPVVKIE